MNSSIIHTKYTYHSMIVQNLMLQCCLNLILFIRIYITDIIYVNLILIVKVSVIKSL